MQASTRSTIAPFYVMEVMAAAERRAAAGGEVLHLEVGQPSTSAPAGVLAAARRALADHRVGYTTATGIPELRRAIAGHYRTVYDLDVDPDRVIVTAGASGGCILAFHAAFDPGDRVAVTEPGYPAYRNMLRAFGVEVVGIPLDSSTRYTLTTDALDAAGPLDGVVVASPSNPTGTAMTEAELEALLAWATSYGVRVISDEIYQGISYHGAIATAAAHPDHLVLQSFSKYWSMTGWRLGWLLAPPALAGGIVHLAQNLFICPPTLSQVAAVAAFECAAELDANITAYAAARDILLAGLDEAGFPEIAPADGAFYAYADIGFLGTDSTTLSSVWLDELGVAVTPGIDFDPVRGDRFIRLSYSEGPSVVGEATARIGDWVGRRRASGGLVRT